MAEIVNLNRFRKKKKRAARKEVAAQNRVAKGRTKSRRAGDTVARERSRAELDGKKRETRDKD